MTDHSNLSASPADRAKALIQRLLPHMLLTSLMHRLTRVRFAPFKNRQIRWFIAHYGVDMSEAANPDPSAYAHFNAFFTRALRAGSRPVDGDAGNVVSPADGRVSALGAIRAGTLLQAKGRDYSLRALLGADDDWARAFDGGAFATIYLSPRDYHRVHMPIDARIREMRYIPGRLFSVNFSTARSIAGLFTRNERLVCLFDTACGPMALVLVGAMLVAGMETVWSGPVTPPHAQPSSAARYDETGMSLDRGSEMGRFNTGSTVIVLLPVDRVRWSDTLRAGSSVRMGQTIGRLIGDGNDPAPARSASEG